MADPEYAGNEKRRFKRLNKQFVVRIQAQGGASKEWDMILIQNISKGGLLFSTDKNIPAGAVFNFKINIALNKNAIACTGKAARVGTAGNPAVYEVGISFTDIQQADADQIEHTVEDFLSKNQDQ